MTCVETLEKGREVSLSGPNSEFGAFTQPFPLFLKVVQSFDLLLQTRIIRHDLGCLELQR